MFFTDARNSYKQSLKVYEKNVVELQKDIVGKDRVIAEKEQELKTQADKATSDRCVLQTRIDELQKSLEGAQTDLKAEMALKN